MNIDQWNTVNISKDSITAELCRRSFYRFFLEFWEVLESETLKPNWHIEYLCDELQQVAMRVVRREEKLHDLVINIPPGSTKSTIVSAMFNAWVWSNDPSTRFISSSYSGTLSTRDAIKTRDIIKSDKYQRFYSKVELKDDQSGKTHYKNTSGGERLSTSTGGTVTGFHGHFILLDDPLSPANAESDKERENTNDYIKKTLSSRKVDKKVSVTILVMQRLHQDDPSGIMIKKSKVKHICLPAEDCDGVRPIEKRSFYKDGLLDPERMSKPILESMKIDLGSYGYAGQMQQRPAPSEGGIWKKEWFNTIAREDLPIGIQSIACDWDLAYTKKDSNSASAYIKAGTLKNNIYIYGLGFDWLEFPELIRYMKLKGDTHYCEDKASGKSAMQTLKSEGINAIPVSVEGDKVARARLATPIAEAGRVFVVDDMIELLLNDSRQGILKFPNNSNDDLADVLSQSLIRLGNKKKITWENV